MDYFESLIGQNQAVELLTQAVSGNRIAPGYLFVGSNGIGKSLAARCFIKLLFSANLTETQINSLGAKPRATGKSPRLALGRTHLHESRQAAVSTGS
ncbi:MAG: ATP-binding protein [Microcoleus sp.]